MTGQQSTTNGEIYKIFCDPVHGHIKIHPLLVKIIDTPEFQRLRNIKQLGGGYYVFPGASHNCFEHCIGMAHLAWKLVQNLKTFEEITPKEELCVQIAALCRDLGHGPFSHVFEEFMKEQNKEQKTEQWMHEKISVKLFEHLAKNNADIKNEMKKYELGSEEGKMIAQLIQPPLNRPKDKSFLYDIVNNETGIDVNRMDYFIRDCHHLGMKNNFSHERYMLFTRVCKDKDGTTHICIRDKEAMNIFEFFHVRNLLYTNVYHHSVKKAAELMITDALKEVDKTFEISGTANLMTKGNTEEDVFKKYLDYKDDILQEILHRHNEELALANSTGETAGAEPMEETAIAKAAKIIKRIIKRDLYKFIGEKIFETEDMKHLKIDQELQNWVDKLNKATDDASKKLKSADFRAVPIKFEYGKNGTNPVEALKFYTKNDPNSPQSLPGDKISFLLPKKFTETKVMVFYMGNAKNLIKYAMDHIEQLWQGMADVIISAAMKNSSTIVHFSDSVVKATLCSQDLEQQTEQHIVYIKEKSNPILTFAGEITVSHEKMKQLDENKNKMETWLKNADNTNYKLVWYRLPSKCDSVKLMLFCPKESSLNTEHFWNELLRFLE